MKKLSIPSFDWISKNTFHVSSQILEAIFNTLQQNTMSVANYIMSDFLFLEVTTRAS